VAQAGLVVVLDVTDQTVLIVGGGEVGRRKASAVCAAGANVRLVALEPRHPDLAAVSAVHWLSEPYRREHLDGVRLAIAAAVPAVNQQVVADAKAAGVWVNSATDPMAGNWTLPAIVRRGPLVLAVSTGGAAPAFARQVRDRLAEEFDAAVGEFVSLLDEMRMRVRISVSKPNRRRELLNRLSDWYWLDRLRRDGVDVTRAAMDEMIRQAAF
jgi:precorrin-2 dehydrogenase/sirohydrochlorin ferrochelatase